MMRDLYHTIHDFAGLHPVAIGTTGTGKTVTVNRAGYGDSEVMWSIDYGTITATAAVFTVVMKEGDTSGTMTSVADADMRSTESAAGVAAAATRTAGTNSAILKRLSYIGAKQYNSVQVKSTSTSGAIIAIRAEALPASFPAS